MEWGIDIKKRGKRNFKSNKLITSARRRPMIEERYALSK
jgi:hypothetical protein